MAARLCCLGRSGDQPGNRAAARLPAGLARVGGGVAYVPEGMKLLLSGGHLSVSPEAAWGMSHKMTSPVFLFRPGPSDLF